MIVNPGEIVPSPSAELNRDAERLRYWQADDMLWAVEDEDYSRYIYAELEPVDEDEDFYYNWINQAHWCNAIDDWVEYLEAEDCPYCDGEDSNSLTHEQVKKILGLS